MFIGSGHGGFLNLLKLILISGDPLSKEAFELAYIGVKLCFGTEIFSQSGISGS